ncbi:unnamed protein product [Oikopleura dioica]|uniref:Uncharacterized protein n=1 Tax=Oikopleura dioica TaxID=34765 RepID=E4WUC0_OIKDI|nr:unnamed protein product [Oikopleura dioica]
MCEEEVKGCEDGHCLCLNNKCEVQECRTNDHCGEKGLCEDNHCVFYDCKKDEHCNTPDNPKKDCRDGKCRCNELVCEPVTCMESIHCKKNEICSGNNPVDENVEANTCYVPECKSIKDCDDQEVCKNNKCEPVDCTSNTHCGDRITPNVCRKNECVPVECAFHDDCEDFFPESAWLGFKCERNKCKNYECTTNFHCGDGQLCNKVVNKCFTPECIGSTACDTVEGCEDGKCICSGNKCSSVDCRTNTHCGWPLEASVCRNNQCQDVGCTANSHCQVKKNGHEASRCIVNQCNHSAECLATNHCADYDDPRVCSDFRCKKVDCLRNVDCVDQHICVKQQCVKVECDSNIDCEKGQICVDNLCVD